MSFLDDLLAGGPDYKVSSVPGGAVFAPADGSDEALKRFQVVAERIFANDGLDYTIDDRLVHRSSDHAEDYVDRMVINL